MPRYLDKDKHDCWSCIHHMNSNGVCDTWCDHGECYKMRRDVKEAEECENLYPRDLCTRGELKDGKYFCSNCKNYAYIDNFCSICGAAVAYKTLSEFIESNTDEWQLLAITQSKRVHSLIWIDREKLYSIPKEIEDKRVLSHRWGNIVVEDSLKKPNNTPVLIVEIEN